MEERLKWYIKILGRILYPKICVKGDYEVKTRKEETLEEFENSRRGFVAFLK